MNDQKREHQKSSGATRRQSESPSKQSDYNNTLALAGGFIAATIVFIGLYQFGSWCTHDRPLSFITGLAVSFGCLLMVRESLLHSLENRD
jgi:F0F1-type ATP synthase assembly protein I